MFETDLCLRALTPDLWALTAPLVFRTDPGPAGLTPITITIPVGFITDLASIPHIVDWIPFLDRTGASRRAGALHDGLYALGRARGKDWCDHMLAVALEADGFRPWQAQTYYRAVNLFGGSSWLSDAREGLYNESIVSGDFASRAEFDAFVAAGRSIFS
jgi:hypothetical protein